MCIEWSETVVIFLQNCEKLHDIATAFSDTRQNIWQDQYYRQTSNISRTLLINMIVDNLDVVGASPVGAAPTTSSLST